MLTKHITQQIEAYLDYQLSPEERRLVEAHVAICPACAQRLIESQHLVAELHSTLHLALGQPAPPSALRQRTQQRLKAVQAPSQPLFNWAVPKRLFGAIGTVAIIALLAFSAFAVIQGQLPGAHVLSEINPLTTSNETGEEISPPLHTPAVSLAVTPPPTEEGFSLRDTLPKPLEPSTNTLNEKIPTATSPVTAQEITNENRPQPSIEPTSTPPLPAGTIAFAFFNPTPQRQVYEIHLINADGENHRLFPLDGVSEPALRLSAEGYQLAYRAWGEPTTPRSLLSSNLAGDQPYRIGGFWEDAQPDWSPTENRLIFASQREMDRRWRLYTIWGEGSAEVNLRREGKSPTFAPDGHRFAFESCDETGNRCGLWVGNLTESEHGSKPFLEDPLAKSPDWSPVSEQLVYMANRGDNWDLYLVDSKGENVQRLTTDPSIDGLPVWSPDGQWLAFLSDRGGNWGIWLLHVDSHHLQPLFSLKGGTFTPPNRPPYDQRNWWDEQLSWSE